jgi:hypothetical protein
MPRQSGWFEHLTQFERVISDRPARFSCGAPRAQRAVRENRHSRQLFSFKFFGRCAIGVARREKLAPVTPAVRSAAESSEESCGGELRHQDKRAKHAGPKNRAKEQTRLKKNWPNKAKFGRILCGGHGLRGGESQIVLEGLQSMPLPPRRGVNRPS